MPHERGLESKGLSTLISDLGPARRSAEHDPRIHHSHGGGCQNYGSFLGTLNIRCCIIIRVQKWTIVLTTTHGQHEELLYRHHDVQS